MSTHQTKNPSDQVVTNDFIHTFQTAVGLFSRQECNQIIELSKTLPRKESILGADYVDLHVRSSKIKWMGLTSDNKWVFERIGEAISWANQFYKFEIIGCNDFQVTEYPVGGHYNFHSDVGDGVTSLRKLSLSVQLSDPADYNGGDLEFLSNNPSGIVRQTFRQQGTAVIFPSFNAHQVTIVTTGCRWSLIAWVYGPPFK